MNRVGRGYSFEALRAKMLFTQGLHKKAARPKFERHHEDVKGPYLYRTRDDDADRFSISTQLFEPEIVFGTDISTLTKKIEAGRF
jgi:hypothetical protein